MPYLVRRFSRHRPSRRHTASPLLVLCVSVMASVAMISACMAMIAPEPVAVAVAVAQAP
jgi:hypothetical protein